MGGVRPRNGRTIAEGCLEEAVLGGRGWGRGGALGGESEAPGLEWSGLGVEGEA